MRIGAIADIRVHQIDIGVGHIGVQVVGRDDRDVLADDLADHRQQGALGVVIVHGQARAVQHAIHPVERTGGAQVLLPLRHHPVEEFLRHRPVRLGHREQAGHRVPRPGRVHFGHEARHFTQHHGRGGAGIREHDGTAKQRAGLKVGLIGDRRETVAFDRESQKGDARVARGHATIPMSPAIRPVALRPLPVSTSTVVSFAPIVPLSNNIPNPATTWADVGST